jgi:glycosyltransferase involved in cell wall biosynthesis
MRILFARRDSLSRADGINSFLYAIIEALLEQGHEIHLAGSGQPQLQEIHQRFPCQFYPRFWAVGDGGPYGWKKDIPIWFRHWPRLVQQVQPDRIVVNGVIPRRNSVRTLGINHDLENRGGFWFARLVRILGYRLTNDRVATCTELRDALSQNIFMHRKKIGILPTCIRLKDFIPHPGSKELSLLHIGTAGYKHPEKSIAALDQLCDPRIRLIITGPQYSSVQQALAGLSAKLRERIELVGVLSAEELRKKMASALAILVPSGYQIPVLSPTVLEGFASGAVVITSPSISRDLIQPGENCVTAETPFDVATAVDRLLADEEWASTIARKALQKVKEFDAANVAHRLIQRLSTPSE